MQQLEDSDPGDTYLLDKYSLHKRDEGDCSHLHRTLPKLSTVPHLRCKKLEEQRRRSRGNRRLDHPLCGTLAKDHYIRCNLKRIVHRSMAQPSDPLGSRDHLPISCGIFSYRACGVPQRPVFAPMQAPRRFFPSTASVELGSV